MTSPNPESVIATRPSFEKAVQILVGQGYGKAHSDMVPEAFMYAVTQVSGERQQTANFWNFGKYLDGNETFLVSIVVVGQSNDLSSVFAVGIKLDKFGKPCGVNKWPPFVRLSDFLKNLAGRNIEDYFGNIVRGCFAYQRFAPEVSPAPDMKHLTSYFIGQDFTASCGHNSKTRFVQDLQKDRKIQAWGGPSFVKEDSKQGRYRISLLWTTDGAGRQDLYVVGARQPSGVGSDVPVPYKAVSDREFEANCMKPGSNGINNFLNQLAL
jgi:hypothetical protein